ncbi:MAG: glycine cleavage system protein GcvH [Desulfovibrio sp.]|nr:glycine cleavage system protein GcvH [Desulfovibrio sp.]
MEFPDDRVYHADHLWAQEQADGTWLVGITDYAQALLGDMIVVELPEVGAGLRQGDACASFESVKAIGEAVTPVSGEIMEVNTALAGTPGLLNGDPYGQGWLVRVKPFSQAGAGCISAAEYAAAICG